MNGTRVALRATLGAKVQVVKLCNQNSLRVEVVVVEVIVVQNLNRGTGAVGDH